jgi:hypothetical protein
MRAAIWTIAASVTLLPACATSSTHELPALIVNPTPESRSELRLAVQRALHSDPIPLSDDALTRSSLLPIERVPRRDSQGRLLNGLEVGTRPQRFRLVKSGKSCVLIHDDADQLRQTLTATQCVPAPKGR